MPQLGASAVDAVYLGGVAVDKLYLGAAAVYTALAPPSQVTGLAVDATGDGTIDLSWTAPASEAAISDYSVEYTPSGGSLTTVLVGSAATTYQLTGLANDTEYSVRVAAVSAGGTGAYSAAVTGTPTAAPPEPVALDFTGSSGTRVYYSPVPAGAATIEATLYASNGTKSISGGIDESFGPQSLNTNLPSSLEFGHNHTGRYFIAGHTNRASSGNVAIVIKDASGNVLAQGTSPSQQFNGGDDD